MKKRNFKEIRQKITYFEPERFCFIYEYRALLPNRKDIEKNSAVGGSKKKRVKTGKYEGLEKVMYEWFLD